MSLRPHPPTAVPTLTATTVRAAFPKGHPYLTLRDAFDALFTDKDFIDLYAHQGPPGTSPAQLALICILQHVEGLSDQETADAVRGRLEWKYLLGLELTDPGFDASLLVDFRSRLLRAGAEERLLRQLLAVFDAHGLLDARTRQRTDSTHVLAAIRSVNRLALVRETLRHAVEALALVAPEWLAHHADPAWVDRHTAGFGERLPTSEQQRTARAEQIGRDGCWLLQAIDAQATPGYFAQIEPIVLLRRIWSEQYHQDDNGPRWRRSEELVPPAERLCSPHDPDARFSTKRELSWEGYKKHVTETCSLAHPRLITEVTTTAATIQDSAVLPGIQERLARGQHAPAEQVVDAGYLTGALVLESAERGIALVGPLRANTSRQEREAAGYEQRQFAIEWEAARATCPEGKQSVRWKETESRGQPRIQVHFAASDCAACPAKASCTQAARRSLTLAPREEYEALQTARAAVETPAFRAVYRQRAGIEGTISQDIRRCGSRRTRFRGLAKVHLGHVFDGCALNLVRVAAWLTGTRPAATRQSRFASLMAAAAT